MSGKLLPVLNPVRKQEVGDLIENICFIFLFDGPKYDHGKRSHQRLKDVMLLWLFTVHMDGGVVKEKSGMRVEEEWN